MLLLIWLGALSLVEILLWWTPIWRLRLVRRIIAGGLIIGLVLISGLFFGSYISVWAGLVTVVSIYRIINLLRILEEQLNTSRLLLVGRQASGWLIFSQLLVFGGSWLSQYYDLTSIIWLYIIAVVNILAAFILAVSTWRHTRTTTTPQIDQHYSDRELPSLTVAIPARNETSDLETCLNSLVSSDYPKLEILVLDDCSQNKHTPAIIRDFAQSGVRFIAGQLPPEQWLAKNYAYHQLAKETNGEVILFCGVDTRFQPGSLRAMIETMLRKDKSLISFMPRNLLPSVWNMGAVLVQPARYAWELSLPRRLLQRPPVLSTCWLIKSKELEAAGGFEAVSRSISPESYFARRAATHSDGYSFIRSNTVIGLQSVKNSFEQRGTAIRSRYPQLHRRLELVAFYGLAELMVLVLPFIMMIVTAATGNLGLLIINLITSILLISFFVQIVRITYQRFLIRGLWTLPLAALFDVGLLNYSMWQYEFREVIWKGRNICIPVMRPPVPNSGKIHET